MKRVGKNSIAVGLATLLISVALSFSAQGADDFKSHSEARYLMGEGPIGTAVADLGSELEGGGAQACEPDKGSCDEEDFVESPLAPLEQLTVPVGTAANLKLGAVNDYAEAGKTTPGTSMAATGAVSNDGIVTTSPPAGAPADATLDLSGSALGALDDVLGNVKLNLGAISSSAQLGQDDSTLQRDYSIAGGELTLKVNALEDVNTAIGGVLKDTLADPITLNATTICTLLTALGESLTVDNPLGDAFPDLDLCTNLAVLDGVLAGKITGLSSVTGGLTTVTKDGIKFDFATGEITVNLDDAVFAATGSHLNDLPPSTHLLQEILPKLVLNLSPLIDSLHTELVNKIIDNAQLEATVAGAPVGPFALKELGEAGLDGVLGQVFDGLATGLDAIGDPLAPALVQVVQGLKPLLDVIVNVPDLYTTTGIVSGDTPGQVSTAAAVDDKFFSETALQVVVAEGALADLRIGNAQVGPNGPNAAADDNDTQADSDSQADAQADGDDAQSDGSDAQSDGNDEDSDEDSDNDNDNDSDSDNDDNDSDAQADADNDRDADAAADADVTSTLPNTGAPNILPLLLLALGLIVFGSAVLINERRRLNQL